MKRYKLNRWAVAALAAGGLCVAMAGDTSQTTPTTASPATGTNAAPTKVIAPARADLPPVASEVVRMSEAGVSEDVMLAYVRNSANNYSLDADQIVYLHDLGISSAVLNALTAHGQVAASSSATEAANRTTPAPNSSSQNATATAATTTSTAVSGAAATYYDTLAPYGTWMYLPAYGWCWQPTVVVVDPGWLPYCNNGNWLWTDDGWYWNSYYSWGWAPFHYGRWCRYPGYGWLWCPDAVWGPAWVCWRDYPGYCGWAPLPPGAYFTAGIGWTFNGAAVGFNFGFGLGPNCFTFCDYDDFCHAHPFRHFYHGHDADRFFHGSRVDNGFTEDSHHHFFNHGIDPSRIEAATHTHIQPVTVRELPHGGGRSGNVVMPDRLARNGNSQVIYRPDRNISVPRNPYLPGHEMHQNWQFAGQSEHLPSGHFSEMHNSPPVNRPGVYYTPRNTPQYQPQPARPSVPEQHSAPISPRSYPQGAENTPHWNDGNSPRTFQMPRSLPSPGYRRSTVSAWGSAPAWHSVPRSYAWRSTPSWTAPRFSRPAPSSGEMHSWGGGAHYGGRMNFGGDGRQSGGGFRR